MIHKSPDELHDLARRILLAAGADERNAEAVAEHVVQSNLCGVDTHGIFQMGLYVSHIREGQIVPTAWPSVVRQTPSSALVSGNWTFGHPTARFAMEVAIEKATAQNISVVSMVQTHHIGRLGHYVEMATRAGMAALLMGGGFSRENPRSVPYGGRARVLDTNPVAIGFPNPDQPGPVLLDFATTAVSGVKVRHAQSRNQPLPPGCIVDKEGKPTTDANDFYAGGSFAPFGGHKGYALMMAAEFLGCVLSGGEVLADPQRGDVLFRHQGVTMIVLKADLFRTMSDYRAAAAEMTNRTRAVPPAPGFKKVLVPGDPEVATRAKRQAEGIPIEDDVWQAVVEAAQSVGVGV